MGKPFRVTLSPQQSAHRGRQLYNVSDHVPKAIYDELPPDVQKEVEVDDTVILSQN